MSEPTRAARIARVAALTGAGAMTAGSVAAALAYQGTQGQPYSPLNHWVSELGEPGVSTLALAFNAGLIVGGLGFALFMLGLAVDGTDRLTWAYGTIGAIAGIAGALVGVFPMDQREIHGLVALTFFNLGWIAVALAAVPVAVRHDRRFPRWLAAAGALTVVVFLAFLYALSRETEASLAAPDVRPDVWIAAALEWALIVMIIGWTVLAALTWRRGGPPTRPPWEHGG